MNASHLAKPIFPPLQGETILPYCTLPRARTIVVAPPSNHSPRQNEGRHMKNARLSKLLTAIKTKLAASIPKAVRELKIKSPAYCLFIWYQDLSVDEYAPVLGVAPVELRDACLSGKHKKKLANDSKTSIWLPQQSIDRPFPGFPFPKHLCEEVASESNECYSILTAGLDLPPADEGPLLMPFRAALHDVARELNLYDWTRILPRSDDFVVLAADYIGYWLQEDMAASIPGKKLAALKARGRLPF
jgi:hypothetical protein